MALTFGPGSSRIKSSALTGPSMGSGRVVAGTGGSGGTIGRKASAAAPVSTSVDVQRQRACRPLDIVDYFYVPHFELIPSRLVGHDRVSDWRGGSHQLGIRHESLQLRIRGAKNIAIRTKSKLYTTNCDRGCRWRDWISRCLGHWCDGGCRRCDWISRCLGGWRGGCCNNWR